MRYRRRTFAAFLAAMVAVYTGICAAQTKATAKVDEYMTAAARLNRFSGTILIAKNGKILISKGYSLADREWGTPNSSTTKFRIGSLTKQFTATAAMMLQDRNLLHVTDAICKYIPSCPAAWQPITIHELLNHTSGIPDYTELPGYKETQSLPISVQGLIGRFKQQPLRFTAGDKFEYSNSGYVLLGSIIETVSGKSYQEFVEENIFRPLKMMDSGYDVNTVILARRASGYTRNGDRIENASYIDMSVPFAAGGLFSTVNDLLLWDQALYAQELVSPKSLQAMFTPYKEFIGYGWAISTLFNRKMIHHNGSVDGFVSNIARFPDDRLLIVVLSNLEQSPVDVITKDLAAIVFGEKYEVPKKRQVVQLHPGQHDAYVGHYTITPDLVLTITREDNRLFGQLSGQSSDKFELLPESETHFFSEEPPVEIVFKKDNGQINGLTLNGQYTGKKTP